MATFTVSTTADVVNGNYRQLSLREVVNRANATSGADSIVFTNAISGSTMVLTGGELLPQQDVRINGDLNNHGETVAISGNDATRIFRVEGPSTDVQFTQLALTNGYAASDTDHMGGAAILVDQASLQLAAHRHQDADD